MVGWLGVFFLDLSDSLLIIRRREGSRWGGGGGTFSLGRVVSIYISIANVERALHNDVVGQLYLNLF